MRKLKLQMQLSVDGYVAGPNGEMDWMIWNWDAELKDYVAELTKSIDTILLGKNITESFLSHWGKVAASPQDECYEFGRKMIETPKIVFSNTLKKSKWFNTWISDDPEKEIKTLKAQTGGDIIVYGGAAFVSSLIKLRLIDEFLFFINPSVLGKGMSIFSDVNWPQDLKLIKSISFDCGIVLLHYEL